MLGEAMVPMKTVSSRIVNKFKLPLDTMDKRMTWEIRTFGAESVYLRYSSEDDCYYLEALKDDS